MKKYGTDQPDIRFGMEFVELNEVCQHKDFNVFNSAELVVGIAVTGGNTFTRKEIDKYIDWVKTPQVGAMGMVYVRCNDDGGFKSSVDKFYDQKDLKNIAKKTNASKGDLIMISLVNLGSALKVFSFLIISKASSDDFPHTPHDELVKNSLLILEIFIFLELLRVINILF